MGSKFVPMQLRIEKRERENRSPSPFPLEIDVGERKGGKPSLLFLFPLSSFPRYLIAPFTTLLLRLLQCRARDSTKIYACLPDFRVAFEVEGKVYGLIAIELIRFVAWRIPPSEAAP